MQEGQKFLPALEIRWKERGCFLCHRVKSVALRKMNTKRLVFYNSMEFITFGSVWLHFGFSWQ